MTPWKLTVGLAVSAAGAALLAPRLLPWSSLGAVAPDPLPVAAPPEVGGVITPDRTGSVNLAARLDHGAVPRGVPTERYLVVEVAGPDHAPGGARSPVDLAVVLDASGSMSDERKIDYARKGAAFLLSELGPSDGFALVTFSNRAHVLLPMGPVGDQTLARRAIQQVVEGGGTNLGDGIEAAIREIRRASPSDVRRVVLLSDGQANVGETDPGALARLAAGLASEGVTVSTIGLGVEYNEDLLARISDLGGGSYDFVDTPNELQAALGDELARSASLVARGATVEVNLPEGVELLEVIGWPATTSRNGYSVYVGDVYAAARRRIVARVRVTGTGDEIAVAQASTRYDDLASGGSAVARTEARSRVTADLREVAASAVPDVGFVASRAAGNWYAEKSVVAQRAGRKEDARQMVQQAREVLITASKAYQRPELDADLQRFDNNNAILESAPLASPAASRAVKSTQEDARDLYK